MNKFAHLHLYTEYSFWKSAVKVKELFAACEKKGISSVAITDSGNMYGVIEFLKAAVRYTDSNADFYTFMEEKRAFKVKPIIGCELRLADESGHIVLLCKNEQGYHNLIKLASKSSTSKGENHNRIDFNTIEKHCNGLICLYGDVKHYEQVKQLKCVFGDDLYIEIQNHVVEYICEKYGADNTSNTVTFGTYSAQTAVKDVCRVYGLPYEEGERLGTNYSKKEVLRKLGEQTDRTKSAADHRRGRLIRQLAGAGIVGRGKPAHGGSTGSFIVKGIDSIEREMQRLNFEANCASRGTDAASVEREMEQQRAREESERRHREYAERAEREQQQPVGSVEEVNTPDDGNSNSNTGRSKYSYGKGD